MSEIESARTKFEQALERLERAVKSVSLEKSETLDKSVASIDEDSLNAEIETLRSQRDDLANRLSIATKDYDSLEEVADKVSMRLDETIDRLRELLESKDGSC